MGRASACTHASKRCACPHANEYCACSLKIDKTLDDRQWTFDGWFFVPWSYSGAPGRYRYAHWDSAPLAADHEPPPTENLSPPQKLVLFGGIAMFCRKNRSPSDESRGFFAACGLATRTGDEKKRAVNLAKLANLVPP
jgi:hypothetical protein